MRLLKSFVSLHPWQSLFLVAALLLSGVAGSIGVSALLPTLQLVLNDTSTKQNEFTRYLELAFNAVGVKPTLGVLLFVILGALLSTNLLIFVASQRIGYIAADMATDLRRALLRAMIASRWAFFTRQSSGALANAMATEAYRASQAYVFALRVLAALVEAAVYIAMAVIASWRATLICAVVGVFVIGVSHTMVRMSRRAGEKQTRWYRELLRTLNDVLASVKTFKAMAREPAAEEALQHEAGQLRKALRRQALAEAGLESGQEALIGAVVVAGIYAAVVVFNVGLAIVSFMVLILGQALKGLGKVQKQYQKMLNCESAYWALQRTIAEAQAFAERESGKALADLHTGIRFENVTFSYGDHPVLQNTTFEIPAGQITCLRGASGAGKTTVADLLIGLVHPDSGTIRVDGKNLEDLDMRAWRHRIGYVPQDIPLMHDTILHNVTLGDPDLSEADATRALRDAGASEFVARLPDGMQTVVGERGASLSGGQRQRISIARALAHRPRLLILDEATSALDRATEAGICATLQQLAGDLTILAVSHQEALENIANRVYRLAAGRLEPVTTRIAAAAP